MITLIKYNMVVRLVRKSVKLEVVCTIICPLSISVLVVGVETNIDLSNIDLANMETNIYFSRSGCS